MMPTDAEFQALQAEVAQLKELIGFTRYMSPRLDVDAWAAAKNAAPTLPSGDRNVADRMREIGISQDSIVEGVVPALLAQVAQQDVKIAALEARPIGGGNAPPAVVDSSGFFSLKEGILWHRAPHGGGAAIYFEVDTNFTGSQRPKDGNGNPTRYRQVFGFSQSGDAGGGMHMNVVFPEDGSKAYIPDPTRFGRSERLDRQGMVSVNIYRAGIEFAPGKFEVIEVVQDGTTRRKGQIGVWIPEESGDMTLRLPQGGKLYIEEGEGNDDRANGVPFDQMNGHRRTRTRREVLLGPDKGSPAIGGLPGAGGT